MRRQGDHRRHPDEGGRDPGHRTGGAMSDQDSTLSPVDPVASSAAPPEAQVVAEGEGGLSGAWHAYVTKLKAGDVGSLPVIVALVLTTAYFTYRSAVFFTALNFANLITQVAVTALIAIGVVFVLLIGEIDLSIGSVTGVCAVCVAYFAQPDTGHSYPGLVAIGLCAPARAADRADPGLDHRDHRRPVVRRHAL